MAEEYRKISACCNETESAANNIRLLIGRLEAEIDMLAGHVTNLPNEYTIPLR